MVGPAGVGEWDGSAAAAYACVVEKENGAGAGEVVDESGIPVVHGAAEMH